ncbi:MAG: type IX secretion system sortase PorU [Bacteroidales bacterium]|jgi:hypothetical protein|nr:type IX secretion system sortase PorU [Bacteroidales bacterium]
MKRTLLFFLLFFPYYQSIAQNIVLKRRIPWEKPQEISQYYDITQKNLDTKRFLFFEDARYYNHNTLLPYYFEIIHVNNPEVKFRITNLQFETLSKEELTHLQFPDSVPEKIEYKSEIRTSRNQYFLQFNLLPLRKNRNNNQLEKLISFQLEITKGVSDLKAGKKAPKAFVSQSVLRSGNWEKIKISKNGVYRLTYSELLNLGIENPAGVKIFGNSRGMLPLSNTAESQDDLESNAIYFEKGSDGIFNQGDYILFYAKGPDEWIYDETMDFYSCINHIYSDDNYLFLTSTTEPNNEIITTGSAQPPSDIITSFPDYIHYENDLKNLIESGQLWFGETFDVTTNYTFDFSFPNLVPSEPVKIKTALAARASSNSSFTIQSGTQTIATPVFNAVNMSSYTSTYAIRNVTQGDFFSNNDNFSVDMSYNKPSASAKGWLDFITLNAQRELYLSNDQLNFRYYNPEAVNQTIEFRIENASSATKVWEVTAPTQVKNIETQTIASNIISIKVDVEPGLNEFVAFNTAKLYTPEAVGNVPNQNLHALGHHDMIIVTHPDFISQAQSIADLHASQDGLSIAMVTPEQIFNEFSSGAPDAAAIRNFIRMIYQRATPADTLKYLLLFGDGSFDHKSITADNINYVMTYQSQNSLTPTSSFVTDDFFGLLDATDHIELSNSGLIDIGIGRLPVKSVQEAQQMVDKIYRYTDFNSKGDWINTLCFVGDDEDNNIHMRDADRIAVQVDSTYPHFFINKLYLDAYPQQMTAVSESYPEVNRLINEQINNGVLIFNYTGHGGENGLAHERILTIDNINSWKNKDKLAIFMTATCEFSRFDNHKYVSAGERVLLNPNGGGIALFSTTRLVYSSPNYTLNKNFFDHVFEKDTDNNYHTLGDVMRLAKINSGTENNKRNFTLLGDPALKLPLAKYTIITDSINHRDVLNYTDTLKALSKVTIHGHIADETLDVFQGFNGLVYPLVLDKKRTVTTLGNDGGIPMDFQTQNNILYKGKASVVNGLFKFSFVVPKDISYNFDRGKISYYSLSSTSDAKGYFNDFIIGGTNNSAPIDNTGPDIKLYMNDESFVSGGITDQNPVLYAILSDSSGINTVGYGIGHDITAILDNNTSDVLVLNDYYESDVDDYQKGKIEYLFNKLEEGDHQLKLKVWDVYNNSSEELLDFIVAESENLAIKNLLNYPNPFTEQTAFYFDHNRPNEMLETMIQVFTVTGKLVKTIHATINSNGFRSDPIVWDGLDDFGDRLGRGVYIYQLKIKTPSGETVTKIEKLVLLK